MELFIIELMNNYGNIGVFLLIMVENLFPPIPSELILTLAGFMTIDSKLTILGVIISSTMGSLIGAFILYYIGSFLNKERLIKIVSGKTGKLLRIKPKDIILADNWFDDKGSKTVFFCRFIPIVRSLISIPAGMSKINLLKFTLYTVFGSLIWNTVLIMIGAYAGNKKELILQFIDRFSNYILFILILIIIYYILRFYKLRKKELKF